MVLKKLQWKRYIVMMGGEEKQRDKVTSLQPTRGLAMMTGYGDHGFKKPQGPNEMKGTTGVTAVERIMPPAQSKLLPVRWRASKM